MTYHAGFFVVVFFLLENSLECLQKRNNAKPQLDYILINKSINNPLNCEAYFFEGRFSNHRIISTKTRLSLRRNKTQTARIARYNWSPVNSDIRNKDTEIVMNKFDTLQETSKRHTPNVEYENCYHPHTNSSKLHTNQMLNLKFNGNQ